MTTRVPRAGALLVASGFGLALLVLFFQRRGGDVGHLPELLGALITSLARGPVFSKRNARPTSSSPLAAGP